MPTPIVVLRMIFPTERVFRLRRKRLPVDEYRAANSSTLALMVHGQLSGRTIVRLSAILQHRLITTGVPPCYSPHFGDLVRRASLAVLAGIAPLARAQQTAASRGPSRQMQPADLKAWKNIRQPVLSNDGKWFATCSLPTRATRR